VSGKRARVPCRAEWQVIAQHDARRSTLRRRIDLREIEYPLRAPSLLVVRHLGAEFLVEAKRPVVQLVSRNRLREPLEVLARDVQVLAELAGEIFLDPLRLDQFTLGDGSRPTG